MNKESQIFPYRGLQDFEKILFLEKQVKTLIKDLKEARFENGVLSSELEEAIHSNPKVNKIKNQYRYIKDLELKIRSLKISEQKLFYKVSELTNKP